MPAVSLVMVTVAVVGGIKWAPPVGLNRSGAGLQAAAEGRQQFQWQCFRHLYQVAHVGQRVSGKEDWPNMPADAAAFKRATAVQVLKTEVGLIETLTVCRVVSSTFTALTAGLVGEHDMVSDLHAFHASTESLNYAGPFMAQDCRAAPTGVAEVNVGVADATGHQRTRTLSSRGPSISSFSIRSGRPGSRSMAARM